MSYIPLTKGEYAIVDSEDFDWLTEKRWCYAKNGYAVHYFQTDAGSRMLYLHRFIMSAPPDLQVDHVNRDRLDCRRENLRFATRSLNQANKSVQANNTSLYKGVSLHDGLWEARIRVDGQRVYLGRWSDPHIAAQVYDAASRLFNADFAGVNYPERPTPPEIEAIVANILARSAVARACLEARQKQRLEE